MAVIAGGLLLCFAHFREKLENNPAAPELIITESSVGYRLVGSH
jgi:DNA-binding response OmpR family regulator